MRRCAFITLLGGAVAWPFAACALQSGTPTVGYINSETSKGNAAAVAAFREGLKVAGFLEGQNVAMEFRFANNHYELLPALAADLIQRQVNVIVAGGIPAAVATKTATSTIPSVFYTGGDAVAAGLVASLNHPGGNLTGIVNLNVELEPKRLELLHQVVPAATDVALIVNPTNPNAEATQQNLETAAHTLGVRLHVLRARNDREVDEAFEALRQLRVGALLVSADGFFVTRHKRFAELTIQYAMPAILQFREFAAAGGLMSYGGSNTDAYRLVGLYTGRILKGENPADLSVQQSTKVDLIINLKTAKALGLTIPLPLLGRADEVIE